MDVDDVTDVVHSNAMFPHGGPTVNGFAFVCSEVALAGCKKAADRQSLIEHAPLSDAGRSQVAILLQHSQFEVPFAELQSVEVHRAHKLRPGLIVVRTESTEYKIGFAGKLARLTGGGGPDPDAMQDAIAQMIERRAPGKVSVAD